MKNKPIIETQRTVIKIAEAEHAELMLKYYIENKDHLSKWEPKRNNEFYTVEHWTKLLKENTESLKARTAFKFCAFNKEETEILGTCNFSNIVYGVFQACTVGYSIAHKYEGSGLMYEIANACIEYIFKEVKLHRIMANYIPTNKRSGALLKKLGFEKEGYAKEYLLINGKWEDHVLTTKTNQNWKKNNVSPKFIFKTQNIGFSNSEIIGKRIKLCSISKA